jgi:anti-sigma factor RsiW
MSPRFFRNPFRRPAPGLSCQEMVELITDYLEGALSEADHERFEAHISACEACTMYLDQIRDTLSLIGSIGPEDLSPAAERELLAAFADWKAGS